MDDVMVQAFMSRCMPIYLIRGRNVDNLPWPFTGKVTITLLNQLADENHHSGTMSFPLGSEPASRAVTIHLTSQSHTLADAPWFSSIKSQEGHMWMATNVLM